MMSKITQGNAEAIAYKLRQGIDNGGIERDALAAFLEWVAESLETDRSIISRLEESVSSNQLRKKLTAAEKIFNHFGGLSELMKWENGQGETAASVVQEYLDLTAVSADK